MTDAASSPSAVVLMSGGLDSTVCTMIAAETYGAINVAGISFRYGQKHTKEVDAARKISDHLGLNRHWIADLNTFLFQGGKSALIPDDRIDMPHMTYEEIAKSQGVSPTYVPFRNGNLLSAAAAYALSIGAEVLYFGAHAEDARGWAYPDCTPEFIGAMANAIYIGTYHKVRLVSPLMWMNKIEIVQYGHELGTPFGLTWSCYEGQDEPCGKCPTCIARAHAFEALDLVDPVVEGKGNFTSRKTYMVRGREVGG